MFESIKVLFVLILFYFPFFFLVLIPSNSIFLRPEDLQDDICTKLALPFLCDEPSVTLAVIKPDGMSHESQIKAIIEENGFKIINDKTEKLDVEQVSAWYSDKQEEPYYPSLVEYLTRGPIRVLALSRRKAVPKLRDLIGPTNPDMARQSFPKTIRALYGTDIQENAIHASDSRESAEKEIKFFFAEQDPTHTRHL
ncbi:hypothetical protein INT47_004412 [Mucor saturninus]|uniref:Nucleoside diphosphate kinase n=2 Tax=Mucor TaxID=4830 RepID=A0A8H7R1K4_9FUNG|nr:hypothetical protein INT47_004412 [Mucor saturninus]